MTAGNPTALEVATQTLLASGFEPDGQTRVDVVRIPTSNSPVYGRSGGKVSQIGGRARFSLPGSDIKATAGKRTISVYFSRGGRNGVQGIASFDTGDAGALRRVLDSLPQLIASEQSR